MPVAAIPLHNPSKSQACPPSLVLRISRGDDDLTILRSIALPVARVVRQHEANFAGRPAKAMQELVGEINGRCRHGMQAGPFDPPCCRGTILRAITGAIRHA